MVGSWWKGWIFFLTVPCCYGVVIVGKSMDVFHCYGHAVAVNFDLQSPQGPAIVFAEMAAHNVTS